MVKNIKIYFLLPIVICFLGVVFFQKDAQSKVPAALDSTKSIHFGGNNTKIDGFRSAKFGMTEKEVLKTIFKDYKVPKSKIKRSIHPNEKTASFTFQVKNLLPDSGLAKLFYVFGYKTKRLIQVNILWHRTTPNFVPQGVVDTANQLRKYFLSQGFQNKGLAVNTKLSGGSILVFRGTDLKGKMVVLLLVNPSTKEGQSPNQNINLRLSYIANPDSPDIYKIKKNDF